MPAILRFVFRLFDSDHVGRPTDIASSGMALSVHISASLRLADYRLRREIHDPREQLPELLVVVHREPRIGVSANVAPISLQSPSVRCARAAGMITLNSSAMCSPCAVANVPTAAAKRVNPPDRIRLVASDALLEFLDVRVAQDVLVLQLVERRVESVVAHEACGKGTRPPSDDGASRETP